MKRMFKILEARKVGITLLLVGETENGKPYVFEEGSWTPTEKGIHYKWRAAGRIGNRFIPYDKIAEVFWVEGK